jgi:hypothetical protein
MARDVMVPAPCGASYCEVAAEVRDELRRLQIVDVTDVASSIRRPGLVICGRLRGGQLGKVTRIEACRDGLEEHADCVADLFGILRVENAAIRKVDAGPELMAAEPEFEAQDSSALEAPQPVVKKAPQRLARRRTLVGSHGYTSPGRVHEDFRGGLCDMDSRTHDLIADAARPVAASQLPYIPTPGAPLLFVGHAKRIKRMERQMLRQLRAFDGS